MFANYFRQMDYLLANFLEITNGEFGKMAARVWFSKIDLPSEWSWIWNEHNTYIVKYENADFQKLELLLRDCISKSGLHK